MPQLQHHLLKLSRHRRGNAYVKIDGQQIWLGAYDDPTTRERYDRLIAEWLANGRRLPPPDRGDSGPTVTDVCIQYWRHAQGRYQPGKAKTIRSAIRLGSPICNVWANSS